MGWSLSWIGWIQERNVGIQEAEATSSQESKEKSGHIKRDSTGKCPNA